jgi:hypothetical protein
MPPKTANTVRYLLMHPEEANKVYTKLLHSSTGHGSCILTKNVPTKPDGYSQVGIQIDGVQRKIMTHHLSMIATGRRLPEKKCDEVSHLCHNRRCINSSHLIVESKVDNNGRKNCMVWIPCPHEDCTKRISVCTHSPKCIKVDIEDGEFH